MPSEMAQKVCNVLHLAEKILLPYFGNIEFAIKSDEERESIVTKADIDAQHFIAAGLHMIDPDIGIVGEEDVGGDDTRDKYEIYWLIDPIDGTKQFKDGLLGCSTMVSLIKRIDDEHRVVFSAINDFPRGFMYYAEKGIGAFCNGKQLRIEDRPGRFVSGFESNLAKGYNRQIRDKIKAFATVFHTGVAGEEFTRMALGEFSGRICLDPWGKDYDFAPGALIVQEAGAIVANIGKRTYNTRNRNFIAALPAFYKQLTEGPDALFPIRC